MNWRMFSGIVLGLCCLMLVLLWRRYHTDRITLIYHTGQIADRGIRKDAGIVIVMGQVSFVRTTQFDDDGFRIYRQGYETTPWGDGTE